MKRSTFLIALGLVLFSACNSSGNAVVEEKELPAVKVVEAKEEMVNQIAEYTGNIEPFVKNNISSSTAQRIEKIYVEVGSNVKKGQLLVQMESINYANAKTQLENIKTDLARTEALYKAGGISQQQYEQLKTQVKVAEENISNLDRNTKLLSPINGVVTARNYDNGDLAVGQPILTVMQLQPVKIMVAVSEEFYPVVKNGTPVEITLDVYDGKRYSGKVSLVYPTIDPTTRTFQAQVSISNQSMEIRPGMFARAKVELGAKKRVVIPDKTVIKQQGTNDKYVFVLDGDTVKYVKVELGRRVGTNYEILSGLEAGQKVVIAGMNSLIDNTKVRVTEGGLDLTL
ncbi:MAG: efflux RND transporter periplasmic adaptor subunit [Bacteroidales bacterium]|jgi:RND family efflux transporter MFP subunit|nr:efflux RND transporter periplasmic adaptor subunit [Bacteroidales bacterium]